MNSLTFGKRSRFTFMGGVTLRDWHPSGGAAVYAITYKPDSTNRPKSHTVVYFGESSDISKHSVDICNDLDSWWKDNGKGTSDLFIFIHEMPTSSRYERMHLQKQLTIEYEPIASN